MLSVKSNIIIITDIRYRNHMAVGTGNIHFRMFPVISRWNASVQMDFSSRAMVLYATKENYRRESMNIQIFGVKKCFDTKKAERYFKERRIKYQFINLDEKPMSKGELKSVTSAVGLSELIDKNSKAYKTLNMDRIINASVKEEMILENPGLIKTPVVRNGKQATVGYKPEVRKDWE